MDPVIAIDQLIEEYSKFSWYDSVGLDKHGRYVVYVDLINTEVMNTVRRELDGKQVLIAYAHSKPGTDLRSRYMNLYDFTKPKPAPEYSPFDRPAEGLQKVSEADLEYLQNGEPDMDYLISELDRLEKLCGSNTLQHIFYEVHDGKNAVTNLSKKFPDVRDGLDALYNVFGFDLIYEEIDG